MDWRSNPPTRALRSQYDWEIGIQRKQWFAACCRGVIPPQRLKWQARVGRQFPGQHRRQALCFQKFLGLARLNIYLM
jgi:hypothetical protein